MNDVMPKEDYEFIGNIQDYMLDSTNMKEEDAWDFAFRIWQSKEWLTKYLLNDARNDIAYEQGRAAAIDECIKLIGGNIKSIVGLYNKDTPLTDRASYRMAKNELIEDLVKQLEQLKEQNNGRIH